MEETHPSLAGSTPMAVLGKPKFVYTSSCENPLDSCSPSTSRGAAVRGMGSLEFADRGPCLSSMSDDHEPCLAYGCVRLEKLKISRTAQRMLVLIDPSRKVSRITSFEPSHQATLLSIRPRRLRDRDAHSRLPGAPQGPAGGRRLKDTLAYVCSPSTERSRSGPGFPEFSNSQLS